MIIYSAIITFSSNKFKKGSIGLVEKEEVNFDYSGELMMNM